MTLKQLNLVFKDVFFYIVSDLVIIQYSFKRCYVMWSCFRRTTSHSLSTCTRGLQKLFLLPLSRKERPQRSPMSSPPFLHQQQTGLCGILAFLGMCMPYIREKNIMKVRGINLKLVNYKGASDYLQSMWYLSDTKYIPKNTKKNIF